MKRIPQLIKILSFFQVNTVPTYSSVYSAPLTTSYTSGYNTISVNTVYSAAPLITGYNGYPDWEVIFICLIFFICPYPKIFILFSENHKVSREN